MGDQSNPHPFKKWVYQNKCTSCQPILKKKKNLIITYNNKYLNMTSICAKLLIQLNEKKDFKHYYIHYITGYWKLTDGEKTTTVVWIASSAHRWQIHWDNVDTTEAKASWKRCAEGRLQHTCHCCLESASCRLCVAQYDKHTQLYCLHLSDLHQTAWLYISFNVTDCDFFFYDWCWLSCMCLATIFTSVEHALCRDGKKRATFCDCALTLTSWIYNSQSASPAVRRQRPGTYKSASILGEESIQQE